MSYWDYMDNKVWESSEVMKELEQIYKKAQAEMKMDLKGKVNELKALQAEVQKTDKALKDSGLAGPADDGETTEEEDNDIKDHKVHDGAGRAGRVKKIKQANIILELKKLSKEAIDNMDYKLAYKVERALASIKEEG
jgi:Skp family chaperone for outer membrane proteins